MLTRFSVTQESRILEVERGFIGSVPSSLLIVVPDIPLDVHILPTFLISVLKIFIAHYIGIQNWWVSLPPPHPSPAPSEPNLLLWRRALPGGEPRLSTRARQRVYPFQKNCSTNVLGGFILIKLSMYNLENILFRAATGASFQIYPFQYHY